ncbi:transposase [Paracraurococcus lichenis]|uniref:Transposase n=1 Tax=Paracraurococcus lichenis TaxID=3064888 RepID=A0ABT9ECK0_9PROT|nr:transposase [Paracraurococcus sp. LOR1-02]MDO9713941.1 transposase [Paracraurococcus sp. LOR1-02]
MALGRQKGRQSDLLVTWAEMPRSPGHVFYDRLQAELLSAGFDGFVEGQCAAYYAARQGRPSLPPGRYFRMLLVGYFEGIDSERGLERRCADSLSLREFLRLGEREPVPDHSWLSRTRARLPLEVHDAVFTWVLKRLTERGLIKGERIGVDASTMEANAALWLHPLKVQSLRQTQGGSARRSGMSSGACASTVPRWPTSSALRCPKPRMEDILAAVARKGTRGAAHPFFARARLRAKLKLKAAAWIIGRATNLNWQLCPARLLGVQRLCRCWINCAAMRPSHPRNIAKFFKAETKHPFAYRTPSDFPVRI